MVGSALINGVDVEDLGLHLKAQTVPRGGARVNLAEVPGRDGYADLTARRNGRAAKAPVTVEVVLWAGPREELAEQGVRSAMLWDGCEVEYTPPDFGGISYRGVATCEVTHRTVNVAEVTVTIQADPVAYGDERAIGLQAGQNARHRVGGTSPAAPVFRLTAGSGVPSVTNTVTGETVALLSAPGSGASVVIDCQKRRATVNGQPARVTLASDFFLVEPGDCTLKAVNASGTATYRERWL